MTGDDDGRTIKKNKRLKEFKYTLGIKAPYVRERNNRLPFRRFPLTISPRWVAQLPRKYITFKEETQRREDV